MYDVPSAISHKSSAFAPFMGFHLANDDFRGKIFEI
jgi:hypothetical protein